MSGRISIGVFGILLLDAVSLPLRAEETKTLVDRYGDSLPEQAIARFGTVRFRQAAMARHILYHPDGKVIATFGLENTIVLWDVESGRRERTLARHTSTIRCGAFSRDGKLIASGDNEQNLFISDFTTGKVLQAFKVSAIMECLDFSPDGKYLGCAGLGGKYQIWNLKTGKVDHEGTVTRGNNLYGLEFSFDNKVVAIGSSDNRILIINTEDWKWAKTFSGGGYRFRFAPDGRHILSIGDTTFTWWNVADGKAVHQLRQDGFFYNVAMHPNGKLAATGSGRGYFKVWNLETGKLLKECATPQSYVFGLAFSPDGSKLATSESSVEIWDTESWQRLSRFDGPSSPAYVVGFAEDGAKLLSIHIQTPHFQVRQWDVATTKEISRVERHDGGLGRNTFTSDGCWLAGWQMHSGLEPPPEIAIAVVDTKTGANRYNLMVPKFVSNLTVSRDNQRLAALGSHTQFQIWDMDSGKELQRFPRFEPVAPRDGKGPRISPPRYVYDMSLSRRGEWLAGVEGEPDENAITIWNTATGMREHQFGSTKSEGRLMTFFRAGQSIVDGVTAKSGTSAIEIWESYTGKSRRRLPEVAERLAAVTVSPDGKLIASGYPSGEVRIWEVATAKQLAILQGHQGGINSLAFSPDSRSLASASWDLTILQWRMPIVAKSNGPLTEETLERCWKDLIAADAGVAYSAILTLAEQPAQSLPYLERQLGAAVKRDLVAELLADLDSRSFQVRERASQELAKMGARVRPAVVEALKTATSADFQVRCEKLLKTLGPKELSLDEVRIERGFEIIRLIDTPEAQKLLKQFLPDRP